MRRYGIMQHEIIVAGFGGQGVLLTGQLLAYAGLLEGKQVAWVPSYGPEMRGGTANCSVIISGRSIGSPLVDEPGAAIVLNQPSLEKFENRIRGRGLLLINPCTVDTGDMKRKDLQVHQIPANEIAARLGNDRVANMVILGAYLELTGAVSIDSVLAALAKVLPVNKHGLLAVNRKAADAGALSVRHPLAAEL